MSRRLSRPLPLAHGHTKNVGKPRASKRGKWRAAVLIGVHVLIAIHILHWQIAGRTITPVEPSEAMQTLELGYVNAGFVLFALLILSTFVFGRIFCGWGCHLVALQDLCGWIMRKFGIRPKPFRSRLLVFVPLIAAFYMFAWPSLSRAIAGESAPRWVAHFTTEDFWAPFPTAGIAILTFAVCGFLIVVLLGNKGFCTYACPYGGIFYYADAVAPGKIRVTDACNGCGHCTTACTSNVRVHEEVREYGMVVDSGCMKCMDCVSVCPKGALYWGFGKPGLAKRKVEKVPRQYDLTFGEEMFVGGVFLFALYGFRGLYDAVPFLLSLGLASIAAVLLLQGLRLASRPNVRLQRWQLRRHGKVSPLGWAYALFSAILIAFLGYASIVMYHARQGEAAYLGSDYGASLLHYRAAVNLTPVLVEKWEARLGALELFDGDAESAARHLRRAVSVNDDDLDLRFSFGRSLFLTGRVEEAAAELEWVAERTRPEEAAYATRVFGLTEALISIGRNAEAGAWLDRLVGLDSRPAILATAAEQFLVCGMADRALELASSAKEAAPLNREIASLWARAAVASGRADELLSRVIRSAPEDVISWYSTAFLYLEKGDEATARALFARLKRLVPDLDVP